MTINSENTPNKNAAQKGLKSDRSGSSGKPGNKAKKSGFNNPLQQSKVKRKNNGQNSGRDNGY